MAGVRDVPEFVRYVDVARDSRFRKPRLDDSVNIAVGVCVVLIILFARAGKFSAGSDWVHTRLRCCEKYRLGFVVKPRIRELVQNAAFCVSTFDVFLDSGFVGAINSRLPESDNRQKSEKADPNGRMKSSTP